MQVTNQPLHQVDNMSQQINQLKEIIPDNNLNQEEEEAKRVRAEIDKRGRFNQGGGDLNTGPKLRECLRGQGRN